MAAGGRLVKFVLAGRCVADLVPSEPTMPGALQNDRRGPGGTEHTHTADAGLVASGDVSPEKQSR